HSLPHFGRQLPCRLLFRQHSWFRSQHLYWMKWPSPSGRLFGDIVMAELNPIKVWRGILSLPNESRTKTIAVAFIVSIVCALLVTGATVVLRPIQAQNRALEQQTRLEALLAESPGLSAILATSDEMKLSTVVVDLRRAEAAQDVTPETLASALTDSANWTELSPQEDIA